MQHLTEGTTSFVTDSTQAVSSEMPVFYNPVMKLNRDLSLLMLASMDWLRKGDFRIGLPMEASGIRAARILNELVRPGFLTPVMIAANDLNAQAVTLMRENLERNRGAYPHDRIEVTQSDAMLWMRKPRGYEYLDLDPFGTPNPFLDAAVQRTSRDGILAVTATDTAALAGTYPAATRRKYWATPSRTWIQHEAGLRILIRKVQLIGAQYEKAFLPVLSVSADHYYRVFFKVARSPGLVQDMLRKHRYVHVRRATLEIAVDDQLQREDWENAGPLWCGPLHDAEVVDKMLASGALLDQEVFADALALLALIKDECRIDTVGFLDAHEMARAWRIMPPKRDRIMALLGEQAARTHIIPTGIKTSLTAQDVRALLEREGN